MFGRQLNATLNLDLTTELRSHAADRFAPGYAIGLRLPREALFRYSRRGPAPSSFRRSGSLSRTMQPFKLGVGFGGGAAASERAFRAVFEIEF